MISKKEVPFGVDEDGYPCYRLVHEDWVFLGVVAIFILTILSLVAMRIWWPEMMNEKAVLLNAAILVVTYKVVTS